MISVGPFDLYRRIGQGGMGDVWLAVHREQALPVAVKVITAATARRPRARAALEREARAVAGLDHPGVVMVLDYGTVSTEAAAASGGRVSEGSPFLAMELGDTDLSALVHLDLSWDELRDVLLAILDTLAHAHARGVVHRDLKPGNILVVGIGHERAVKLADFGLAWTVEDEPQPGAMGSPHYMAPEQITGKWRDFGPWTDLYALGCTAWELAAGATPFLGNPRVFEAHLNALPPAFGARMAVPSGLEGWLRTLLEKSPRRRFQTAADAAWSLLQLGDATVAPTAVTPRPARVGTTQLVSVARPTAQAPEGGSVAAPDATHSPPLPTSWATPRTRPSMQLLGAGLALHGLRVVGLVDREAERDALWESLRGCREAGRFGCVVLDGPVGTGKSRLAEWLCQRAHEVGSATVLRAQHTRTGGPGDGVGPMLVRFFRCAGLDRADTYEQVRRVLDRYGPTDVELAPALTELMSPGGPPDGVPPVHFASATERFATVRHLLTHLSGRRPVILWIDDAQWGPDALALAAYLLDLPAARQAPVLVVLTALSEALGNPRPADGALEGLTGRPHVRTVHVGALPEQHRAALVEELLGPDGDLARQVRDRTGGVPMFAVQLVGDWVARGLLEVTDVGWRVRPGARLDLPDALHDLWARRLELLLEPFEPQERQALELAAVLGQHVDGDEWRGACGFAGLRAAEALVARMVRLKMAQTGDAGRWSFAHAMLHETLVRMAREAGRLQRYHGACAGMLEGRTGDAVGRFGRHLAGAGLPERALTPLLHAAATKLEAYDSASAESLLEAYDLAMHALDPAADDPRRGAGWRQWARLRRSQGRLDDADRLYSRLHQAAERHGWSELLGWALFGLGDTASSQSDYRRATQMLELALDHAVATADTALEADCRERLGAVQSFRGNPEAAEQHLRRALELHEKGGRRRYQVVIRQRLGVASFYRGDLDEATRLLQEARGIADDLGYRHGVANACNSLGEVARARGEWDTAEDEYRRAAETWRAMDHVGAQAAALNLALVLMERGKLQAARPALTACIRDLAASGRTGFVGIAELLLAACVARIGDWESFLGHFDAATRLLRETDYVDPDIARFAARAGDDAQQAGHVRWARAAYELSLAQWRSLNRAEDARAVERSLSALP